MRIRQAYANMLRAAAQEPGAAIGRLLSALLNKIALILAGVYLAIIMVVGIVVQNMLIEAGAEPGLLFDLAFYAFMVLLLALFITPAVVMNSDDVDSDTHGSARFSTGKEMRELTDDNPGLNRSASRDKEDPAL